MNELMAVIYDYIFEHTPSLNGDPEYQKAIQAYTRLEEEVKEIIGDDLLYQYQYAEAAARRQWDVAVFCHTLHLIRRFMLEVSGQSQTSIP